MGRKCCFFLLLHGAVLSLGISFPFEDDKVAASVQQFREKQDIPRMSPSSEQLTTLAVRDIVKIVRGREEIGDAFAVSTFLAVAPAHIFNSSLPDGHFLRYTSTLTGLKQNRRIADMKHPACENVRTCTPNVVVLTVNGAFPNRGNFDRIFHEEISPEGIKWAEEYISTLKPLLRE